MILPYRGVYPELGRAVFVEESARVIGDVRIGDFSSVWFNVVIRADVNYIRIGERTNVQDNSTLHVTRKVHPLIIGNEVTIGHGVILHGCTLEDRILVGMGAIVLDGARIGECSIIGAGAIVTEGTEIPPRSLALGVPARVVRTLKDEEVEKIVRSAENYTQYAKHYMDGQK